MGCEDPAGENVIDKMTNIDRQFSFLPFFGVRIRTKIIIIVRPLVSFMMGKMPNTKTMSPVPRYNSSILQLMQ